MQRIRGFKLKTDRILENELAKATAINELTGTIIGSPDAANAAVMISGVDFAANILPSVDHHHIVTYSSSYDNAIRAAYAAMRATAGFREFIETAHAFDAPVFFAVIDSGFHSIVPTIACATFERLDEVTTNICICASTKEGSDKEKTSIQVVLRIVSNLLRQMMR